MFPLQRLPFLAGREVIKSLDVKDMIALSVTSKKGRALLKSMLPNYRLRVEFQVYAGELEVVVKGKNMERIRISPVFGNKNAMALIVYFIDIFKKPIVTILLLEDEAGEFALELIRMVKQLPCLFYELYFGEISYTADILKQILDECTNLHELNVEGLHVPETFQYVPPTPDSFKLQMLTAHRPTWIKLEDFMHCKRIKLDSIRDDREEIQYLNNFLEKWKDSECGLESLELQFFFPDMFPMLAEGLSDEGIQHDGRKQYVEIERKNGKKAVISASRHRLTLEATLQ